MILYSRISNGRQDAHGPPCRLRILRRTLSAAHCATPLAVCTVSTVALRLHRGGRWRCGLCVRCCAGGRCTVPAFSNRPEITSLSPHCTLAEHHRRLGHLFPLPDDASQRRPVCIRSTLIEETARRDRHPLCDAPGTHYTRCTRCTLCPKAALHPAPPPAPALR